MPKTWRARLKPAPIGDGAFLLLPQELLDFLNWQAGTTVRIEINTDGHIQLVRYHKRGGEGC